MLDFTLTLAELARRHPVARAVLRDHGLDTGHGGTLPLAEAARRHGLDADALRATLEREIARFDEAVRAAVGKGDIA